MNYWTVGGMNGGTEGRMERTGKMGATEGGSER